MAAEQRKLLEQLRQQDQLSIHDPQICRSYCVDYCVDELFENTKIMNLSKCQLLHSDKHRDQYRNGPRIWQFEQEFDQKLRDILEIRSKRIREGLKKLRPTAAEASPQLLKLAEQVEQNERLVSLMAEEIKMLVLTGRSDQALEEARQLQTLREQHAKDTRKFNKEYEQCAPNAHQHLLPCRTCGLFIPSEDTDERLEQHFAGRMHLGFVRVLATASDRI